MFWKKPVASRASRFEAWLRHKVKSPLASLLWAAYCLWWIIQERGNVGFDGAAQMAFGFVQLSLLRSFLKIK